MTFSELRARLDARSFRTDAKYTANRDGFIHEGLRWIQRTLLTSVGLRAVWQNAGNIIAGTSSVLVPTDYRPSSETTLFWLDGTTRRPIVRIPLAWLGMQFYDQTRQATVDLRDPTVRGVLTYFAFRGRVLELRPAADVVYTLELHGISYLPTLAADGDTNLLTIEAEDLCLYAALRQCWQFFEDAGRMAFWNAQAKEAALGWASDRVHEESEDYPLLMQSPG